MFDGFSQTTGGLSSPRAEIQLPMPYVPTQSGYPKPDGSWMVLVNNTGVRDRRCRLFLKHNKFEELHGCH